MSYFGELKQNVVISAGNSSTANLNAGATFTGTSQSTLGVVGIQINLKTDQNCTIYVDQAMDDVPNWDITDSFVYYASKGGAGFTVQATGKNCRVRVTNNGAVATTYFRLAMAMCPIVEALPRALSEEGNLKAGVYEIEGDFETRVMVTPMEALKVSGSTRLVGVALASGFDANFWTQTTATGSASTAVANATMTLSTGVTTGSSNVVNSARTARYVAGHSNYYRGVVRTPAITGANTRRWGAFDVNNGYFFETDGTTLKLVCRKGGSDANAVTSGSFNGTLGATYILDTNCHTFQICWTNKSAWFFIDSVLLHKFNGATATLVDTPHLRIGMECTNGANINNNTLEVRVASIQRLGELTTAPQYAHISTLVTQTLKTGPGQLHSIVFGTLPTGNGTITVYDNTAGSGTIIWSALLTRSASVASPLALDFKGLPFNIGLTVVTAVAAADFTVIYE